MNTLAHLSAHPPTRTHIHAVQAGSTIAHAQSRKQWADELSASRGAGRGVLLFLYITRSAVVIEAKVGKVGAVLPLLLLFLLELL